MQIWQLFIVLRQPVVISVTVFSNQTKLTNDLFISPLPLMGTVKTQMVREKRWRETTRMMILQQQENLETTKKWNI